MLGVVFNYLAPDKIFGYLLSSVAWIVLWVWTTIMLCHFNYWRALSKGSAPRVNFRLPGAPYTNWAIILAIGVIAVLIATNGATRITFYVIASWLGILIVAYDVKSYEQSTTTGSN